MQFSSSNSSVQKMMQQTAHPPEEHGLALTWTLAKFQDRELQQVWTFSIIMLKLASLTLLASGGAAVNVTQIGKSVIGFGSAVGESTLDAFFPGSDGSSVGVYETHTGAAPLEYIDGIDAAAILMSAASDGAGAVVAAGLLGAAVSSDEGATFVSLNDRLPHKLLSSQDVKFEAGAGGFAITGIFFASPQDGIAIASSALDDWRSVPRSATARLAPAARRRALRLRVSFPPAAPITCVLLPSFHFDPGRYRLRLFSGFDRFRYVPVTGMLEAGLLRYAALPTVRRARTITPRFPRSASPAADRV